jgi:hypothetical protein
VRWEGLPPIAGGQGCALTHNEEIIFPPVAFLHPETVPEVVGRLRDLPVGSHTISFFASQAEARDQAVDFLAGAPTGHTTAYWVSDPSLKDYYAEEIAASAPDHVGCVLVLPGEQVARTDGKLRPVEEVREFVTAHPDGVSAGAETITQYWAPQNVPDHLEYEAWFHEQPRDASRFLCPYDLRRIPPDLAPDALRDLGAHHTHAALSASKEPAARLLQLFIFGFVDAMPPQLRPSLKWALEVGLVEDRGRPAGLRLTAAGQETVRAWSVPLGELPSAESGHP